MRVDTRQFRRHVVHIDRCDGGVLGTGFFVAPGWVLTAAHVVYDQGAGVELDRVVVVPADSTIGGGVEADVAARSAPAAGVGLWPFPDLALLRLPRDTGWSTGHPCVWLAAGDPLGRDCHAYGFVPREDGAVPPGSPAAFEFEGIDGDGYLRLKAGQAAPGLSGAPLVCPVRRAVVGVVTATRDRYSDLGGWASPVAALLSGGPGVPDDLAAYGAQLAIDNPAAVLADRVGWHAVLPVDGVQETLQQPWAAFVRRSRSSPADLLRADYVVVPYLFRDSDLDAGQGWCEQTTAMEVALVAGRGGAGKTRYAIELCRRMADRGWLAGMWSPSNVGEMWPPCRCRG